jgi:hypothetical protein
VADGSRWQRGGVEHTRDRAGGRQDGEFPPFLTRFGGVALVLRGMVAGRRWWRGWLDIRFARAALQARQLIPQLLALGTELHHLSVQRFDDIEQVPDELAHRRVGDGIQVDVGKLHTLTWTYFFSLLNRRLWVRILPRAPASQSQNSPFERRVLSFM